MSREDEPGGEPGEAIPWVDVDRLTLVEDALAWMDHSPRSEADAEAVALVARLVELVDQLVIGARLLLDADAAHGSERTHPEFARARRYVEALIGPSERPALRREPPSVG